MQLELRGWNPDVRNTRQGYCACYFPALELTISDIVVHCFVSHDKPPRWWFAMPARKYTDRDGAERFWAFVLFSEGANKRFQAEMLAQLGKIIDLNTAASAGTASQAAAADWRESNARTPQIDRPKQGPYARQPAAPPKASPAALRRAADTQRPLEPRQTFNDDPLG